MRKAELLARMARDPAAFRDTLRIDAGGDAARLGATMDAWQRADFEAMDPAWRRIAGHVVRDVPFTRAWLERPRGHSKSQDAAVMSLWALAFSPHAVRGIAAAADRDQAAVIREGIERLLRLNPWLSEVITASQWKVTNVRTGSELSIMAADVASSWGLLLDFVVADEVSMWRDDGLWVSLLSAAAKKPNALLLAILNAGFTESWAYGTRQAIVDDPTWYFHALDGPVASWITPGRLEEQKRLLPAPAYNRLWLNEWSRGAGDALDIADIDRAVTQQGPMTRPEPGYCFGLGVDIGVRRDSSAVAVLAADTLRRRVRVADVHIWRPGAAGRVDLVAVKHRIWSLARQFSAGYIGYDPYQCESIAQELQASDGLNMVPVPFTGPTLMKMATAVLEAFRTRMIDLFPHPQLIDDLRRLIITEKQYGFRLESPRTSGGHGDVAAALCCVLPTALEAASMGPVAEPEFTDPWGNRSAVTGDEMLAWLERQQQAESRLNQFLSM